MKILLIAGHGNGDPGATAKFGGTTYREADETRRMVSLLAPRLQVMGASVTIYNQAYNAYEDWKNGCLTSRAKFENFDYVFEVHLNALALSGQDGKTKGVEIYVTTTEKSTGVEDAICRNIAAIGFTNRGVKRKNFSVISTAKKQGTSSARVELCFIDDYDDMTLYVKCREKVADAIVAGIAEGFGLAKSTAAASPVNTVTSAETPAAWAKTAWDAATAKGVTDGTRPTDPVTRQEVVTMMHRLGLF